MESPREIPDEVSSTESDEDERNKDEHERDERDSERYAEIAPRYAEVASTPWSDPARGRGAVREIIVDCPGQDSEHEKTTQSEESAEASEVECGVEVNKLEDKETLLKNWVMRQYVRVRVKLYDTGIRLHSCKRQKSKFVHCMTTRTSEVKTKSLSASNLALPPPRS